MAEVIKMPRLSDTMTEGVIAAWHVKKGDTVSSGDLLAEVETDKATMDVESFYDGTVLHLGVEEGDGIPVGSLLVVIGEEGEDVSEVIKAAEAEAAGEEEKEEEKEDEAPQEEEKSAPQAQPAEAKQETKSETPVKQPAQAADAGQVAPPPPESSEGGRIKASPLARKMAADRGIDISNVNGSGENGRIVKRDIESYQEPAPAAEPAAAPAPAATGQESFEEVRVSQMRKTIAKRLADSKFTAPHFYLTMEIDMEKAVEARKVLNELSEVKISFNDMVIKSAAVALRKHPAVNAAWLGDKIRYNQHVHVGMAVAVDEGLLVPVIRFADTLGLSSIAKQSKDYAKRARERKLDAKEWEGNTFTVSNLGMYGIEEFTAIINPPDACILAIGGIIDKPVVKDGAVVPGKRMKVTLSCDHRVVDGATGAEFLVTLKGLLEDPMRMLL